MESTNEVWKLIAQAKKLITAYINDDSKPGRLDDPELKEIIDLIDQAFEKIV